MLNSTNLLENKVVLITGASRGIGFEIAKSFVEHGAIVYANARTEGSLEPLFQSISENKRDNLQALYFDVTDYDLMKKAFVRINKEQKRLDCLVNNAGIMEDALIGMISNDNIKKHFDVNVIAPIQMLQFATKFMKRKKSGSIINISSIIGLEGNPGQLVYSSSKGAIISMTKSAAKELAQDQIRVNAIAPGVVATDLFHSIDENKQKEKLENIRMNRAGVPTDIANAALFMASDLSEYMTGQIITVDGSLII